MDEEDIVDKAIQKLFKTKIRDSNVNWVTLDSKSLKQTQVCGCELLLDVIVDESKSFKSFCIILERV